MLHRTVRSRRLVAAVLAGGLLATGCGGSEDPLQIGFRRVALDLAFKDAEKAPPVDPEVVIRRVVSTDFSFSQVQVVDEAPSEPTVIRRTRVLAPPVPQRDCPEAPEGATPQEEAFAVVKDPPKVGVYPRHNEGTVKLQIATREIELPVPALSRWTIPHLDFVKASTVIADGDAEEAGVPPDVRQTEPVAIDQIEFQLVRRITFGFTTTDTYRYTKGASGGDWLYLVKRETLANGQTSTFTPSPPIRVLKLGVTEGNLVDSGTVHGGVDRQTNVAMTVTSQILERQPVDVCGTMVDTYRVQIQQQYVDLATGDVSGNEGGTSDYWNIQFDNGLLIVREEVHRTLRTTTEVFGQRVPVVVRYDYVSTLDDLAPQPLEGS